MKTIIEGTIKVFWGVTTGYGGTINSINNKDKEYKFMHQGLVVAGPLIHFGALEPGSQKIEYVGTSRFHVP